MPCLSERLAHPESSSIRTAEDTAELVTYEYQNQKENHNKNVFILHRMYENYQDHYFVIEF
jgi:hypothetical protein